MPSAPAPIELPPQSYSEAAPPAPMRQDRDHRPGAQDWIDGQTTQLPKQAPNPPPRPPAKAQPLTDVKAQPAQAQPTATAEANQNGGKNKK